MEICVDTLVRYLHKMGEVGKELAVERTLSTLCVRNRTGLRSVTHAG